VLIAEHIHYLFFRSGGGAILDVLMALDPLFWRCNGAEYPLPSTVKTSQGVDTSGCADRFFQPMVWPMIPRVAAAGLQSAPQIDDTAVLMKVARARLQGMPLY
jgi:hypothetical protein